MSKALEALAELGPLTAEEIQTLQVDAALRLLGQIDACLVLVNEEFMDVSARYVTMKAALSGLTQRRSILQTICRAAR